MDDDLLRRKYAHRFRLLDAEGNGHLESGDFTAHVGRLLQACGQAPDSPKARAAYEASEIYWSGVAQLSGVGTDERVTAPQFVDALLAARENGMIHGMLRPTVAAHVALADTDDDGAVDIDEFTALQGALGVPAEEAREAFRVLDRDGDGTLSVDEWLAAAMDYYTSTDPTAPGNAVIGHFDDSGHSEGSGRGGN